MKYQKIRNKHFSTQVTKLKKRTRIDISNWKKNPYTFLKAKLFIIRAVPCWNCAIDFKLCMK